MRDEGNVIPVNLNKDAAILPSPLHIEDPNALIVSDLHIPYLIPEMLDLAIRVAKKYGITRVIIAGDVLNMDAVSTWPAQIPPVTLKSELATARRRLEELEDNFRDVYIFSGNHDVRLARKFDGSLSICDLGLPGEWNENWYCQIGGWMIVHPSGRGSSVPVKTARDIAEVYRANVMAAHTHLWGMTKTKCGMFEAVEIGCMCDDGLIPYKAMTRSRYPIWTPGFALLIDNVCHLYDEERARREIE